MGDVMQRFCFQNLLSFLLQCFSFLHFCFFISLLFVCLVGLACYSQLMFSFLPLWGKVYYPFSFFGSLEFQFMVGTAYFGNFLCLGICYPFHLYILVHQIYLSLSESYISASHYASCNYALLVCAHLELLVSMVHQLVYI